MRFKAVILIEWVEGMHRLAGRGATLGLVFLSQITKHQVKVKSRQVKRTPIAHYRYHTKHSAAQSSQKCQL